MTYFPMYLKIFFLKPVDLWVDFLNNPNIPSYSGLNFREIGLMYHVGYNGIFSLSITDNIQLGSSSYYFMLIELVV